jgi:hypothetical protein
MIALFLDRMTCPNISRRLSAAEALAFLDRVYDSLTSEELARPAPPEPYQSAEVVEPGVFDRWASLPSSFTQQWKQYRNPQSPPLLIRLVRLLGRYPVIWFFLTSFRRVFKI